MKLSNRISNAKTIVTGASSGIGLALAQSLAARGAHVALLARPTPRLDQALKLVQASRQHQVQIISALPADITHPNEVEQACRKFLAEFGAPDLVLHSAGGLEVGHFQQLQPADYQRVMAVNFLGSVYTTRELLPAMISRKAGSLVFISSVLGRLSPLGYSAYGPSKAAVDAYAESIRMEVKAKGIHVMVAYPSDTDTPQLSYENQHVPPEILYLKSIFTAHINSPEEVAKAILDGVDRRRQVLIPDLDGKQMDLILRLFGRNSIKILDLIIAYGNWRKKIPQPAAETN